MIREATLHHPARDKKEKTSNNFLKSPLCGCEQSCSERRGRIAICCIIEYCFLQYIRKYIRQIYKDNPVHASFSSVFYPPLTFLVRFSLLLPDKIKTAYAPKRNHFQSRPVHQDLDGLGLNWHLAGSNTGSSVTCVDAFRIALTEEAKLCVKQSRQPRRSWLPALLSSSDTGNLFMSILWKGRQRVEKSWHNFR